MERTLLLVDDDRQVLHSLARLFRNEGYRLLTAASGAEALDLLARNDVQVIVSDQWMPSLTGVELLTKARELYPDSIRIILSGHADLGVVTRALNIGHVDKFLFKPWDDELLLASVREAFAHFSLLPDGSRFLRIFQNLENPAGLTRKLLFVDSDENVLNALLLLFRDQGYYLLTARSAQEALRQLEGNDVGVILADQRLPDMNGIQLMHRVMMSHPNTVRLVMSAYPDVRDASDAINEGHVYKFLFKPWNEEQLLAGIREAFVSFNLAEKGARFYQIYENTQEAILISDRHNVIQAVNPAFTEITGYEAHETLGKTPAMLKSGKHDAAFYQAMWSGICRNGKWCGEIIDRRKNGETYPSWLNIFVIRGSSKQLLHYIALFSDITGHKREMQQLRDGAYPEDPFLGTAS
jgi:PAS domain S-box-containing protein